MANAERKKPLSVKLDDNLQQRLKRLSESRDRSVHWLMRQAIESYVDQEEQANALRQETLQRWQEVEDGKTIDNAAIVDWLESWGEDKAKDRPR